MSKKLYPEENIQAIANAIRAKNGSSDTYTTSAMAEAIANIPTNTIVEENDIFVSKAIGDFDVEKLNKIIGASVVWNQLVQNGNFASRSYWSTYSASFSVASNICSFTASAKYGAVKNNVEVANSSHKYLIKCDVKLTTATTDVKFGIGRDYIVNAVSTKSTTDWQTLTAIQSGNADYLNIRVADYRTSGWDSIQVKNIMCIDLTQMFGSIIADYVNTLETTQTGSGIAWLKSYGFFTEEYYAYSANTIQSVSVSGHKIYGKNLLDESEIEQGSLNSSGAETSSATRLRSGYVKVAPNTQYTASVGSGFLVVSFHGYSEIGGTSVQQSPSAYNTPTATFTTNSNVNYVRFIFRNRDSSTIVPSDITNVQCEYGSTATAYTPYITPIETNLDHTTLRGIFKLDANNNLYADGDIYNADGSGSVVYGEKTFNGTENWQYASTSGVFYLTNTSSSFPYLFRSGVNALCKDYLYGGTGSNPSIIANKDKHFALYVGGGGGVRELYVKDTTYSTTEDFKTHLSSKPLTIMYELATPTTASLTPFNPLSTIEQGGTEEFVDYGVEQETRDIIIPPGSEIKYIKIAGINDI